MRMNLTPFIMGMLNKLLVDSGIVAGKFFSASLGYLGLVYVLHRSNITGYSFLLRYGSNSVSGVAALLCGIVVRWCLCDDCL
jgi:hypothetical protein